ncbi:MAG: hypothetical protein AB9919_12380 [Geobacteraceae bacterium]
MSNNLFSALYKWAHRHDENFLTEAFVYLLQHLLNDQPASGIQIIERLTCGLCNLSPEEADLVSISTQVSTEVGKPDIEIRTKDCLVFIEVKKESGLGHKQLENYRSKLLSSGFPNTKLVLLTRYPVTYDDDGQRPDVELRWMQISEWLDGLQTDCPVTTFLLKQFQSFLYERGIRMEKVGWQLPEGQRSLRSLLAMVAEAITSNNLKIYQRTAGWDWIGYYLEGKSCFIGYYFDKPEMLRFEGYLDTMPESEKLICGELEGKQWKNYLNLASEEKDFFFAQSKTSQFRLIEEFLGDSWKIFQGLMAK